MPEAAAERADYRFKGLPPDADGMLLTDLAAERRPLFGGGFTTPLLTLDAAALEHNLAALAAYCTAHGLAFAPHGKTSMAPQLFHRQLEHGAWGITLAVPHQVRVAYAHGVKRIFLANELVDPAALRWVGARLDDDPELRFVCYVDSVAGVRLMDEALRGRGGRPVDVVVELGGGPDARTGARTEETCREVADAVAASPALRLAGVAGYEAEATPKGEAGVREWLRRLTALAVEFDKADRFEGLDEIVVSAGGSEWFDAVADSFAALPELSRPVLKLLRSGAYVSHDDVHYARITPFNRLPEEGSLAPAFRIWTQVVSLPEPGQAFVNAGKRDLAYDLDLPVPLSVRGLDGTVRPARGLTVRRLSDQHAWLDVADGAGIRVGEWVALGMSHPCTIFDKWQLIPVVEADGTVSDFVRTYF
ncbi:amino acid deaminase [Streptomyces sp. NPDC051940]|uniref:amino acid deaminase n=1 Tax=Streptomyces sp. NPDC051940 TaxID=3155675 RepID=UPI0034492DF1